MSLDKLLEKQGGKLHPAEARAVFQQLAITVDFCHQLGKVNRDLKLSNILISTTAGQPITIKVCKVHVVWRCQHPVKGAFALCCYIYMQITTTTTCSWPGFLAPRTGSWTRSPTPRLGQSSTPPQRL